MLAGNPATGESAHFPDQVSYTVGTEISVNPRLTVAFDVLGHLCDRRAAAAAADVSRARRPLVFDNIGFVRQSFNTVNGAIGFKADLIQRLLLQANLLFKIDEHGLRDKVTPLIGLEYTF